VGGSRENILSIRTPRRLPRLNTCILVCFVLFRHRIGKEMASAKDFTDNLECPICSELYTDPRVLPCGHTFCFKCINQCRGNRQPGQSMPCPFCRNAFTTLPNELPKNYSVENILGKMKESAESTVYCDQHADEKIKIYCTDCQMATCTMCFITSHNGHKYSG